MPANVVVRNAAPFACKVERAKRGVTDRLRKAKEAGELLLASVCRLLGRFDEERHAGVRDGSLADDRPGSLDTVRAFQKDGLTDVVGVAARLVFP